MAVGESSDIVRERVIAAREAASRRFAEFPWATNSEISATLLRTKFRPESEGNDLLNTYVGNFGGLRGSHRALRVAWSLADLADRKRPTKDDVALAIHLRNSELAMAA